MFHITQNTIVLGLGVSDGVIELGHGSKVGKLGFLYLTKS